MRQLMIMSAYGACLLLLVGCSLPMGARHQSTVDGNSITYVHEGDAPPTVVFESGLGDGLDSWSQVYDSVKPFASVFAYSRPGYSPGFNNVGSGDTRTAADAADLLDGLLRKNNVAAPYVLVGHSIGGLYVMQFAAAHPDRVKGLVLVDGRLPQFTRACEEAGLSPCKPPTSAASSAPPHIAAEIRGIETSERNAPSADELPMPVLLLAATEPPPGAPEGAQAIWLEVHSDVAGKLPDGELQFVEGSGHYIQRDDPQAVVAAIRRLLTSP